ncbi:MAG: hypothetical protein KBT48_12240, partial [Firmicutes bacterium]|nr:hypothetical protein [Bacillota bacterium]
HMEKIEQLQNNLEKLREDLHWTIEDASNKTHIPQATWIHLEMKSEIMDQTQYDSIVAAMKKDGKDVEESLTKLLVATVLSPLAILVSSATVVLIKSALKKRK